MSVFAARHKIRDLKKLLTDDCSDEALNRALDTLAATQRIVVEELAARSAQRIKGHQASVVDANAGATDRVGRHRSPVTGARHRRSTRCRRSRGSRYRKGR
jgi:hypothetical protein